MRWPTQRRKEKWRNSSGEMVILLFCKLCNISTSRSKATPPDTHAVHRRWRGSLAFDAKQLLTASEKESKKTNANVVQLVCAVFEFRLPKICCRKLRTSYTHALVVSHALLVRGSRNELTHNWSFSAATNLPPTRRWWSNAQRCILYHLTVHCRMLVCWEKWALRVGTS